MSSTTCYTRIAFSWYKTDKTLFLDLPYVPSLCLQSCVQLPTCLWLRMTLSYRPTILLISQCSNGFRSCPIKLQSRKNVNLKYSLSIFLKTYLFNLLIGDGLTLLRFNICVKNIYILLVGIPNRSTFEELNLIDRTTRLNIIIKKQGKWIQWIFIFRITIRWPLFFLLSMKNNLFPLSLCAVYLCIDVRVLN